MKLIVAYIQPERLPIVQKMIMTDLPVERKEALQALLPFQREDFAGLFRVMDGLPVIIRLIDPPLHEFVGSLLEDDKTLGELAEATGRTVEQIRVRIEALHEFNPMLGHRGCRLGISYPEITEMQARAILEAAGVKNILTKQLWSRNPNNVVKATMDGLRQLRTVEDFAARAVEHDVPASTVTAGMPAMVAACRSVPAVGLLCNTTMEPKPRVSVTTSGFRRSALICGRLARSNEPVCRSTSASQFATTLEKNECAIRAAALPFGLPGK